MKQIVKRKIKRVGRADDDRFEIKPEDPSLVHSIDAQLTRIDRAINDATGPCARGNGCV
jgi:hypothetical protein